VTTYGHITIYSLGDIATQVGLILKRTIEDSIHYNIYPRYNPEAKYIDWFTKPLTRKKGT